MESKTRSILAGMWKEAYEKGSSLSFNIASGSMSPVIEAGDIVTVVRVKASKVRIGDIVAFWNGCNVIVHRIIGKRMMDTSLVLRHMGDAGVSSGEIEASNLIGRVLLINKNGNEFKLDTPWYIISNKIMAWRSGLLNRIYLARYGRITGLVRFLLRPIWRLYKRLLLRCVQSSGRYDSY